MKGTGAGLERPLLGHDLPDSSATVKASLVQQPADGGSVPSDLIKASSSSSIVKSKSSAAPPPSPSCASWIRLLVAWVCSVLCGGLIPGQALFTQKFAEAGVYRSVCNFPITHTELTLHDGKIVAEEVRVERGEDELHPTLRPLAIPLSPQVVLPGEDNSPSSGSDDERTCDGQFLALATTFSVLQCVAVTALLPAGICFDTIGGRATAVLGALLLVCGLLVLSLVMFFRDDTAEGAWMDFILFPMGLLLTDFGSWINNYGLFGFLFHVPGYNGLLLSLSNSCSYIAAFLPVFLQDSVMTTYGISFPHALLGYSLPVGVSALLLGLVVPSQREYYAEAERALGMPIARPRVSFLKLWTSTKQAWELLTRPQYWPRHRQLLFATLLGNIGSFVYISMPQPYAAALFNFPAQHQDPHLGSFIVTNLAVIGLVASPVVGVVLDFKHGLESMIYLTVVSLLLIAGLCSVAHWDAQRVVVRAVNLLQISLTTILMRYILYYTPANRVGVVSGSFLTLLGAAAVPCIVAMNFLCTTIMPKVLKYVVFADYGSPLDKYDFNVWQFALPTTLASAISAVAFLAFLRDLQLPDQPPLLPEDELEISRRFAVGTVDDAAFVLDLDRNEFLRLCVSQDVLHMKELVDRIVRSSDRLLQLARKRAADAGTINLVPAAPNKLLELPYANVGCSFATTSSYEDVDVERPSSDVPPGPAAESVNLDHSGTTMKMSSTSGPMSPRLLLGGSTTGTTTSESAALLYQTTHMLNSGGERTSNQAVSTSRSVRPIQMKIRDRSISPETATQLVLDAFWPIEGADYEGSPLLDWLAWERNCDSCAGAAQQVTRSRDTSATTTSAERLTVRKDELPSRHNNLNDYSDQPAASSKSYHVPPGVVKVNMEDHEPERDEVEQQATAVVHASVDGHGKGNKRETPQSPQERRRRRSSVFSSIASSSPGGRVSRRSSVVTTPLVEKVQQLFYYQQKIGYHVAAAYGRLLELHFFNSSTTTTASGSCSSRGADLHVDAGREWPQGGVEHQRGGTSKIFHDTPPRSISAPTERLAAVLYCLPPKTYTKIGSPEYYYGMAAAGLPFPRLTPELMRRDMLLGQILADHDRSQLKPHWYIQTLATAGWARGQGAARQLLSVVFGFADRDNVGCYLETDSTTAPYFEKFGFSIVWRESLRTEDDEPELVLCGMWRN
ncbi:unnamed protein product [Amoebophrya sp. A120]|nr:unnamed protein product [Amoebophrya sp. A120]|eukprot:GSA120T00025801001.1